MKIKAALAGMVLVGGSVLPAPILLSTVHAQTNGESRCGADGYVERYSKILDSWQSSGTRCSGSGGGGYSRGGSGNGNGGGRGGEPQDGDTKCGADGKVYHYYGHSWSGGILDCK